MPLPGLVVSKKWSFLNEWALTDRLYQSYKKLPSGKFKLVKMRVMSHDVKNSPFQQTVDAFIKLVLTIGLAVLGVLVTLSIATLNFINGNSEMKKDYNLRVQNVNYMFDWFQENTISYLSLEFIGVILFLATLNHIFIGSKKEYLLKCHLTVIAQIEKEQS